MPLGLEGLVVMEAASFGLPTVAQRDAPGISDVIAPDETGFFSARDPHAYAALVEALLENPARRRAVGDRARGCVMRADVTAARVQSIYRALAASS